MSRTEHRYFVGLLEKYKIILEPTLSPMINRRKRGAAKALVEEYNKKCVRKTTIRKIFKKISNMKARLKEKNYRNLHRTKKLKYLDWERKFLDIWVGNGITVFPNKIIKKTDGISILPSKRRPLSYLKCEVENSSPYILISGIGIQTESAEKTYKTSDQLNISLDDRIETDSSTPAGNSLKENNSSNVRVQPKDSTSDDITDTSHIKIEHENQKSICIRAKKEEENSQFSTRNSVHVPEANGEFRTRFQGEEDEYNRYESMTLDELKRMALITQIKTIKEQAAAARAKKELKLYKLLSLKKLSEIK